MKRPPVWLIVLALLTLGLAIRPEPNRPAAATLPGTPGEECAISPCRHIAHDLSTAPPEQLPPPTPDAQSTAKREPPIQITEAAPALPKEVQPASLMVGPDGVIYRRTSPGNSLDHR